MDWQDKARAFDGLPGVQARLLLREDGDWIFQVLGAMISKDGELSSLATVHRDAVSAVEATHERVGRLVAPAAVATGVHGGERRHWRLAGGAWREVPREG